MIGMDWKWEGRKEGATKASLFEALLDSGSNSNPYYTNNVICTANVRYLWYQYHHCCQFICEEICLLFLRQLLIVAGNPTSPSPSSCLIIFSTSYFPVPIHLLTRVHEINAMYALSLPCISYFWIFFLLVFGCNFDLYVGALFIYLFTILKLPWFFSSFLRLQNPFFFFFKISLNTFDHITYNIHRIPVWLFPELNLLIWFQWDRYFLLWSFCFILFFFSFLLLATEPPALRIYDKNLVILFYLLLLLSSLKAGKH